MFQITQRSNWSMKLCYNDPMDNRHKIFLCSSVCPLVHLAVSPVAIPAGAKFHRSQIIFLLSQIWTWYMGNWEDDKTIKRAAVLGLSIDLFVSLLVCPSVCLFFRQLPQDLKTMLKECFFFSNLFELLQTCDIISGQCVTVNI